MLGDGGREKREVTAVGPTFSFEKNTITHKPINQIKF
jgi:hypothetical protein